MSKLAINNKKKSIPLRIGIWGEKEAGKTTYITVLSNSLRQDPHFTVTFDPRIQNQIEYDYAQMLQNGLFPKSTPWLDNTSRDLKIDIYKYILKPTGQSRLFNTEISLEFIDISGEFYENLNLGEGRIKFINRDSEKKTYGIIEYLKNCHGIIFLLDPAKTVTNPIYYQRILNNLFRQLKKEDKEDKCRQYIAFCVTKIDDNDYWEKAQKSNINLVKSFMGKDLFNTIDNYFYFNQNYVSGTHKKNHCNFYGISSIGRYQENNGQWLKAVKENKDSDKNNPHTQDERSDLDDDHSEFRSVFDDDNVGSFEDNTQPKESESNRLCQRIKTDVDLVPINVKAPIKWLIKSIQSN